MKKNGFISGVLALSIFGVLAKIIGAVYRIPLTYILSSEGMGLYQMVFPLYALMLSVSSSGFPSSMSKIISAYNAKHEFKKANDILKYSIILLTVFSLVATFIVFVFGKSIAMLQGNSNAGVLYMTISPAIIIVAIISGLRGYFQGNENMLPSSISLLIEQVGKLVFGLVFAKLFSKFGIVYAVIGAILGVVLSEVLTLIFLLIYFAVFKKRNNNELLTDGLSKFDANKQILAVVIPITLGSIIMPISMFIDSSLVVNCLQDVGFSISIATSLFGLSSGIVGSIINMPVVFASSINTALLPLVSKSFVKKNTTQVSKNISFSLLMTIIIVLPICVIMFFYSDMIIDFLYRGCLVTSFRNVTSKILKFGAFSTLYLSLIQVTTGALQGISKTLVPVISLACGVVVKIILTLLLVKNPSIHIYGSIIASIMCYGIAGTINLWILLKKYKFIYFTDLIKCLLSNVLFVASCLIVRKVVESFAQGKVALVLSVIFSVISLCVIYYMMYNSVINSFINKRKIKKKLNKA